MKLKLLKLIKFFNFNRNLQFLLLLGIQIWLRKKKSIELVVLGNYFDDTGNEVDYYYIYNVYDTTNYSNFCKSVENNWNNKNLETHYNTYEEALKQGIIESIFQIKDGKK